MIKVLFVFFLFTVSPLLHSSPTVSPIEQSESTTQIQTSSAPVKIRSLDLKKVVLSSPLIYSSLFAISVFSLVLWLYSLATFRSKELMPRKFLDDLVSQIELGNLKGAEQLCLSSPNLLSCIISAGLQARGHGMQIMVDHMKHEGKRATSHLWQRLALLNDVAIVAPMLGLLGTVIGMFYAFYDVNRSVESINALFDGLGVAVGTTVMGLIIAILSMVFATTLKYRLVNTLSLVENTALSLSTKIKSKDLQTNN